MITERASLKAKAETHNNRCSSVPKPSALWDSCNEEQTKLETEKKEHIAKSEDFNNSLIRALELYIDQLKKKVQQDEREIGRFGFERRAAEFEDWVDLSAEAQKEFEEKTKKAIIDFGLAGLLQTSDKAFKAVGSFNPPKANTLITQLKELGAGDPYFFDAIRGVANVRDKRAKLETVQKLLEGAVKGHDLMTADSVGVMINVILDDPQYSLLWSDLQFAAASVYNRAAREVSKYQINQLTALTESQLKALQHVTSVLQTHVSDLKKARQQLAALSIEN